MYSQIYRFYVVQRRQLRQAQKEIIASGRLNGEQRIKINFTVILVLLCFRPFASFLVFYEVM